MTKEFYPTIKDFKKMGLTDYQIQVLIEYENYKHGFREQFSTVRHSSEPNSVFFLDIKNTLYHCGGHGNSGVLGRAGDTDQIFMRDILALGSLLEKNRGQYLTIHNYPLCEDNSSRIEYEFPSNKEGAEYKLDIPTLGMNHPFLNQKRYYINSGPYKVVFISSDTIETQKNIILFFLLIYRIYFKDIKVYTPVNKAQWLDSTEVLRLEKIFESCGCNYDEFITRVPEYKRAFDDEAKEEVEKILAGITFLSTQETGMTKVNLMRNFIFEYNIKNGLSHEDYNIFACGDNYSQDGPMIKLAFQLGGYGCINDGSFNYNSYGETLRKDLCECYDIETRLPLTSYSFCDFYNKALDRNSLERTWDLAETMEDVNNPDKSIILNRFKKTNHYVVVRKK